MKHRPGDEVFIKAEITDVSGYECSERPYFVAPDIYSVNWVSEDKIIPMDKTYADGMTDAWELADKINNMKLADIVEVFGIDIAREEVFKEISPQEALAKIETYEFMQRIQEGDVVEASNGLKGVVVKILPGGGLNIIHENGLFSADCPDVKYKKTGKHLEIAELLRQIGE